MNKTKICSAILILIIVCISGCAKPLLQPSEQVHLKEMFPQQSPEPPQAFISKSTSNWTTWNRFWFASALGGQTADMVTTLDALDSKNCVESNPILGEHPNDGIVIGFKIIGFGLAFWITEYVFKDDPKQQNFRNWMYGVLAVTGTGAAVWNANLDCN